MHTLHNSFGITANGLSLMRTQIERSEQDAVFTSLHGDRGGHLLRIQVRAHNDPRYSYGIVEMVTQAGWVPLWKVNSGSVYTKFVEVEDGRPEFYFAEDMELLLQVGVEILTLYRAGGRL